LNLFLQSNKPTSRLGEGRQFGNSDVTAKLAVLSKWVSIFLITAGPLKLAMVSISTKLLLHTEVFSKDSSWPLAAVHIMAIRAK
jgi:hypothetical protein